MAISYKPMVKPLPGSRSQSPMRTMEWQQGDSAGITAQPLPANPMQQYRPGDLQLLAGGGGGIGGFFDQQFNPQSANATTPAAPAPAPMAGAQGGIGGIPMSPQLGGGMTRGPMTNTAAAPAPQVGVNGMVRGSFDPNASMYGRPLMGGGYSYAPDLRNQQLSPQDQQQVNRDRQYQHAGPGPYGGLAGMQHFGPLQSRPAPTLRTLPAGTVMPGGTTLTEENGRIVGRGAGTRPNEDELAAGNRRAEGRTTAYVQTGPPAGGLSADMEAKRQSAIANQESKRESLKTGRRDRAIAKHGLTHLTPSYASAPLDSGRYGSSSTATNSTNPNTPNGVPNYAPGQAPNKPATVRTQERQQAESNAIFANAKDRFDPKIASLDQSIEFMDKEYGNWSDTDKAAFKDWVNKRAADDEKFRKELDAFSKRESVVSGSSNSDSYDHQRFARMNRFRELLGLPPMKMDVRTQPEGTYGMIPPGVVP